MTPSITLKIGGVDYTDAVSGLTFSNADPGGYEQLSCSPQKLSSIKPGDRVVAYCGLTPVFWGEVNEPGQEQRDGRDTYSVVAFGAGNRLKRTYLREIFVDRDLSHFVNPPSTQRMINVQGTEATVGNITVAYDGTGNPAVIMDANSLDNDLALLTIHLGQGWYDAQGIEIGGAYLSVSTYDKAAGTSMSAPWAVDLIFSIDDVYTYYTTHALSPSGQSGLFSTTTGSGGGGSNSSAKYFLSIRNYYPSGGTSLNSSQGRWMSYWKNLAVFGTHGLTKVGGAPYGFYPTDIARWVFQQIDDLNIGVIGSTTYVLYHSVYFDSVPAEQIVADMALQLGGWHWGVWEPSSLLSTVPEAWFTAVPQSATVSVSRYDCPDITIPKIKSDTLYDQAIVKYTDAGGHSNTVTVSYSNPFTDGDGQTLTLDAGISTSTAARSFGELALDIAFLAARGSGTAELPLFIEDAKGGVRPSATLKAGRDRLRIRDLPDVGAMIGDTRRYDTFHVRRVETTVDDQGIPRTRVDFDGGGDLMETLNARLAEQAVIHGSG